ncbi:hypothetical protein SCA03_04310 [Streptomyces cacaoi]|uniref:Uncharacterized protein n=1 Tax=Streptomyces cacaoi TaxID=1898 RepID=A0A4Y3QV52_STRCI|nr:hypothetical protein SCA03_04310 [Streptomyces cacaoi]
MGWSSAAAAAPTPSQAAAPDSECAGPIMRIPALFRLSRASRSRPEAAGRSPRRPATRF